MTELFSDNGHLNIDALKALCSGEVFGELERLEIAEHLSFCDCCIINYTELLDASTAISSEPPLAPGVIAKLRNRLASQLVRRYAAVAVAASFAILFWNIGVFDTAAQLNGDQLVDLTTSQAISFSETSDRLANGISEAVNKFVATIGFERGFDNGKE